MKNVDMKELGEAEQELEAEFSRFDWFGHVMLEACGQGAQTILCVGKSGERHCWKFSVWAEFLLADFANQGVAIFLRHANVGYQQVGLLLQHDVKRFGGRASGLHRRTVGGQHLRQQQPCIFFITNHQDRQSV